MFNRSPPFHHLSWSVSSNRCAKAESGLREAQAQVKDKTKALTQLQVGVDVNFDECLRSWP
jgi:hypothetical protein